MFAVAASGASRFYRQTNTAGNAAALWQTTPSNDQSIQADITPRAFDGADRWFGLVTRYTDANNYYYVTARSGGGIQLKRMLGGTFTTLGTAALPVAIGTTNRIRLESVGDHIRVLVNNRPVDSRARLGDQRRRSARHHDVSNPGRLRQRRGERELRRSRRFLPMTSSC